MSARLAVRQDEEEGVANPAEAASPVAEVPAPAPPPAPAGGWAAEAGAAAEANEGPPPLIGAARFGLSRVASAVSGLFRGFGSAASRRLGAARAVVAASLDHPTAAEVQSGPPPVPRHDDEDHAEPPPSMDEAEARARVDFVLQRLPPKGDPGLPGNIGALGLLLADVIPLQDFQAVDLLQDCFPRGSRNSQSRLLMAVARNTTRNFGRPGRLPITSGKAWANLDPDLFNDELAAQLAAICSFVLNWQANEKTFLILEFPEIELIEYLFENLHPRRHFPLLVKVMDFKVLSSRRIGLLRRVPSRVRRFVQNPEGRSKAQVQAYVDDTVALLTHFTRPENFSAVAMAARIALAEMEKIAATLGEAPGLTMAIPGQPPASEGLHPVMRGLGNPESGPPAPPPPPIPLPQRPASLPVASPTPTPRRRFTKKQKTEAVLRVLQGEEREWVALSLGVSPELLSRWQDAFISGGSAALVPKDRKAVGADPSIDELKGKLHALIQTVEALSAQIANSGPAALPPPAAEAAVPAGPKPARAAPSVIALPGPVEEPPKPAPLALPAPAASAPSKKGKKPGRRGN